MSKVVPLSRRFVYHFSFDGLGPARTLLLQEAWYRFGDAATAAHAFTAAGPLATHFFLADPDWVLALSPLSPPPAASGPSSGGAAAALRQELASAMDHGDALVLAFQIFDRNGASSRWLDWFLRAQPHLKFKYRWHEMLDVAPERWVLLQ
jgi:hypothetical protein